MTCRTQMFFARQGTLTPEMQRVAEREGLPPETIRDEVATGRLIIPANVNHLAQRLDPMAIGKVASVNIDAIREAIIAASPVPIGTVPIYQAIQIAEDVTRLTADDILDNIEHQAKQ